MINPIEAELGKYYYIKTEYYVKDADRTCTREFVSLLTGRDTNFGYDETCVLKFYDNNDLDVGKSGAVFKLVEMREVDNPFLGRLI